MSTTSLGRRVFTGSAWQFASKFSSAFITLFVQMILARMLLPEDFALIAISVIFLELSEILVDAGFGSALIQKEKLDSTDLSSAFICNVLFALICYGILYYAAPSIEAFFAIPHLSKVVRVSALGIPISSFGMIQNSLLARDLRFKERTKATIISIGISSIVCIVLAFFGFGMWALVLQILLNRIIYVFELFKIFPVLPVRNFSFKKAQSLLLFGSSVLGVNLIAVLLRQLPSIVIGRAYSAHTLAYVNMASKIEKTASVSIEGSLMQALYPAYSRLQCDSVKLAEALRTSVRLGNFIYLPVLFGIAASAHNLVFVLFGSSWMPSVPYLQAFCISALLILVFDALTQSLLSLGHTKKYFLSTLANLLVSIGAMAFCISFGSFWVLIALLPGKVVGIILAYYFLSKEIQLSFKALSFDFIKSFLASLMMGLIVLLLEVFVPAPRFFVLCLQILIGIAVYILASLFTQRPLLIEFRRLIKG
ncbi:MAG: lipopolysaccharide biosynthesis protein [Coriobacteriia bacterium]|nr:lipopolysaccharide biosynthesis protein [Coriobacteriia bacterium]